jgi:large repetitive protein
VGRADLAHEGQEPAAPGTGRRAAELVPVCRRRARRRRGLRPHRHRQPARFVGSGEYYLTPWVDPYATLLEDTLAINVNPDDPNAVNNNNYKAGGSDLIGFRVIGTPPVIVNPDLAVIEVSAEPKEWAGEEFTVGWTVRNNDQGVARGVYDDVYVSDNAVVRHAGREVVFARALRCTEGTRLRPELYADAQHPARTERQGAVRARAHDSGQDTDRSNDVGSAPTDVRDRIPDLKVTAVVPEAQAFSGEKTLVRYTVTNDSTFGVWPQTKYWTDQIWLSKDPVWIPQRERVTRLASVQQANQPLAGGASYTREVEVTLPPGIEGPYFLYVFTNVSGQGIPPPPPVPTVPFPVEQGDGVFVIGNPYETYVRSAYEDATNNMARATLPVIYREPDLRVTDLQLPDTVAAGSTIDLTFTVSNVGNRETREDSWTDRIFISFDPSLDTLDAEIASKAAFDAIRDKYGRSDGKLRPGESYTATVKVAIPYDLNGEYQVLAFADANRQGSIRGRRSAPSRHACVASTPRAAHPSAASANSRARATTSPPRH